MTKNQGRVEPLRRVASSDALWMHIPAGRTCPLRQRAVQVRACTETYSEHLRSISLQHARRRVASLQQTQSTSLSACTSVESAEHAEHMRREAADALHASRSLAFGDAPSRSTPRTVVPIRNEHLELVEQLVRGPRDFHAPQDDPTFAHYEPYSRVALRYVSLLHFLYRTRILSHELIQQYMDCRYAVSPSQLYSFCGRHGQPDDAMDGHLEVPVYGDWVLFATLAEKSPLKYTATPADAGAGEERTARKYLSLIHI